MDQIRSELNYHEAYKKSIEHPEEFWAGIARDFVWKKPWDNVLQWDFNIPEVKWFSGGKLNITENCLDRHVKTRGNQTAIIWEPNNPKDEARHISYEELYDQVCKVSNMLKAHGIKKGDRVCIYMPMIPELAFAALGCARIGAVHSVVFAGFSSGSLADRINDSACKLILTADGAMRGDKKIDLKSIVDEALMKSAGIEKCIVFDHAKLNPPMKEGRDAWWHNEIAKVNADCTAEEMDAEDMLFILYTSGSTGKPKGILLNYKHLEGSPKAMEYFVDLSAIQ